MAKLVKVICKSRIYYAQKLRDKGSIIMFDLDSSNGKLPKCLELVGQKEELRDGEEIEQPEETTLSEITEKSGPKLSKASTPAKSAKKGK